jgi:hypothetical protein
VTRNYSNSALDTTLNAGIGAGDVSMVVASATGWPAAPFAAVLDPGSLTIEEVVQVTAKVGTTFTITRGFDGTTAAAHALAAVVRHAAIAGDFTDLQAADSTHAALTTTAHGGIVASSDSRLTNARTPTAHASTHASAGSDPLTLAESQITNLVSDLAGKAPSAGSTSITTLGTIGAGTWQGTLVSPTYGGTGVNNGAFALTVPASGTAALLGITNQFTPRQDIGGSGSGWSSCLYASGDGSLPAGVFRGYARGGIETYSDSNNGIYAQSTSGTGVRAISSSSTAVWATTSNPASNTQALLLEITGSTGDTNNVANGFDLHHTTTDTPIAGFGVEARFFLKSTTTQFRNAGELISRWNDPTDTTRQSDMLLTAYYTNNQREILRGRGGASNAQIGFLGATPVSVQSVGAAGTRRRDHANAGEQSTHGAD